MSTETTTPVERLADALWETPLDTLADLHEQILVARSALTAALDRDEIARVLEREFGGFLAHDPHNPGRFWGNAADAVIAHLLRSAS